MALLAGHYQSSYSINVARADVSDPNDLLAVVATWPKVWQDPYREREAIMAINASPHRIEAQSFGVVHIFVARRRSSPPQGPPGPPQGLQGP